MRLVAIALAILASVSCLPQQAEPSPSPTSSPRPTSTRPHFELASYMYALQTKGKVRIAVLDNTPPFAFREPNGAFSGFEADLGRELAKAIFGPMPNLDAVIEWVPVDRPTMGKAVADALSPAADVALGPGVTTTSLAVDRSDPYLVTGERILIAAANDEIRDIPDLDSQTVCVTQSTSVGDDVQAANAYAKVLALDSYASCLGALQRAQVDAIVADELTCWQLAKQDTKTKLVGRYLTTEQHVMLVKKSASNDREGFISFLNGWLAGAIRDGTWARLYAMDIAPFSKETKTSPLP